MEDNVDGGIGGTGAEDSSSEMSEMLAEISSSVFPDSSEEVTTDEPEVEERDAAAVTQPVTATEPVKTEQPTTTEGTVAADKLPTGWKPEVAQKFSTLPDDVKSEILKREEDFFKGINDYKVAADYGHSVHKMLQPYQQRLQENGTNPVDYIASLARADNMIATAPTQEQKVQYFRELANMYGITVDHGLFGAEDSTVTALRQELNQLKSSVNNQLSQAQAKEVATIQKTIDEFKAKPEHKHFDVLQHEIAALLQSGVAKDLKDAYDRALWANPTTRVAEQTRLQEDKAKADAELQKKALEEAKKKKGINVRSTVAGSSGGKKTIEQTLNDTYDALQSRASH